MSEIIKARQLLAKECEKQLMPGAAEEVLSGKVDGIPAMKAILAALQPQWQDISTAPRDGTEIIARGVRHGTWGYTEDEVCWTGVRWQQANFNYGRSAGWKETKATAQYSNGFTPSEWMPLPAAPEVAE